MHRAIAIFATVSIIAALPAVFRGDVALTLLGLMATMAVLGLSYNMLMGETGLLSFGHAVYFGLGGFAAIHAMNFVTSHHWGVPLALIPLAGGLGGLLFGMLFGWFSTRHSGTTFAMISLGLGELVMACAQILPDIFGGESGITTDRARLALSSACISHTRSRSIISSRAGVFFARASFTS